MVWSQGHCCPRRRGVLTPAAVRCPRFDSPPFFCIVRPLSNLSPFPCRLSASELPARPACLQHNVTAISTREDLTDLEEQILPFLQDLPRAQVCVHAAAKGGF